MKIHGYDRHPDFDSAHATDESACDWIANNLPDDDDFPHKMARLLRAGSRSIKVRYWVHRKATPAPKSVTLDDSFPRIAELFGRVLDNGAKRPRVVIGPLMLGVAGDKSAFPGSVTIKHRIEHAETELGGHPDDDRTDRWHENRYVGRIHTDGRVELKRGLASIDAELLEHLRGFESDPVHYAATYGKQTGVCCYCRTPLSDPRSVEVGYGPKCASRWGLPWGIDSTPRLADLMNGREDS